MARISKEQLLKVIKQSPNMYCIRYNTLQAKATLYNVALMQDVATINFTTYLHLDLIKFFSDYTYDYLCLKK